MSEERIDNLLRQSMTEPAPQLSPGFDRRLEQRLRPRSLSSGARWALILYAILAVALSVWLLPFPLEWSLPLTAVLGASLLAVVYVKNSRKPRTNTSTAK